MMYRFLIPPFDDEVSMEFAHRVHEILFTGRRAAAHCRVGCGRRTRDRRNSGAVEREVRLAPDPHHRGHGHDGLLDRMALLYLSQHPDTLELLANDLSLMPAAVEEFLRLFSPVFLPGQVITRDVEIAVSISSRGQGDARWGPRPRILRSSTIL